MSMVDEKIFALIEEISVRENLNERSTKILIWFAKEAMGIEGRIPSSKLKQQLLRMGKAELEGDTE